MNKNIKVALLFVVSFVFMVLAYYFMQGTLFQKGDPTYSANFSSVESLKVSDKVYLKGVIIGSINDMKFENPVKPNKIKVSFTLKKEFQIPIDSKLEVISTSLMGNKGLKLIMGENKNTAKSGDVFTGIDEVSMFGNLSKSIDPLAQSSSALMENANGLFDRQNQENLYKTMGEVDLLLRSLQATVNTMNAITKQNQSNINNTLSSFSKISSSLSSRSKEMGNIVSNADAITSQVKAADLSKSINKLNSSMDQLNTMMKDLSDGKGTMGKIMKDEEVYNNMNATLKSANELLEDMKANPKRYVSFSLIGGKK